jgi:ketosteroid isomerase-like protein
VSEVEADDVEDLFFRLTSGDHAGFADGCGQDIVVTVRHGRESVSLDRAEVGIWFHRQYRDSGATTLCSVPSALLMEGEDAVVILGHALRRDGDNREYQTINHCQFEDGLLSRWTMNPVNLLEYALAWNLPTLDLLLPA